MLCRFDFFLIVNLCLLVKEGNNKMLFGDEAHYLNWLIE